MLKSIMMVTMLVTNLNVTEEAYNEYLDYEVVSQGIVDEGLAEVWGAEAMVDHPYLIMQPSSGEPVYLRFIEDEEKMNYRPMGTHGWNSTEYWYKTQINWLLSLSHRRLKSLACHMTYTLLQMLLGQCRFWAHPMKFYT